MKRSMQFTLYVLSFLVLSLTTPLAMADPDHDGDRLDDNPLLSVTVSFGWGLNTAMPGTPPNEANDRIVPSLIRVKKDGVVNFVVAGFHQIFVYDRGVEPEDIVVPAEGTFVNDLSKPLIYQGLSPVGVAPAGFSNARNRVESVSFAKRGTYLVICNVRNHFLGGMYAFVKVH